MILGTIKTYSLKLRLQVTLYKKCMHLAVRVRDGNIKNEQDIKLKKY